MTLPRVMPPGLGLDSEDDPVVLGQRATSLWHLWQRLERCEADTGPWTKAHVKVAAVQLVHQYASTKAPLPYELARLIQAIIKPSAKVTTLPVQVDNVDAYWEAVRFEAKGNRTYYAVAKHLVDNNLLPSRPSLDTAKSIVREWQKKAHYRANVRLYFRANPQDGKNGGGD